MIGIPARIPVEFAQVTRAASTCTSMTQRVILRASICFAFLNEDGSFDLLRYLHAVDILITAQIFSLTCKLSHRANWKECACLPPMGLGLAILGHYSCLLELPMTQMKGERGLGTMMAILCGEGYLMSARLSEKLWPFEGYAKNAKRCFV